MPTIAVPRSFREKRLWRMFLDHDPRFALFGDKLAAKAWMTGHAPGLMAARTLWSAASLEDFRKQPLSRDSVIKASRGCARNLFLDEHGCERALIEPVLRRWLGQTCRQFPGRRFGPKADQRIFAEAIISTERERIIDLNFFCCDGRVMFLVATTGEKTRRERVAFFTPDGQRCMSIEQDPSIKRNWLPPDFALPGCYGKARSIAEALSRSIDFVRVDLMCAEGTLFACEMTPYPSIGPYMQTAFVEAGMAGWDLRLSCFMQARHTGLARLYQQALWRRLRQQP